MEPQEPSEQPTHPEEHPRAQQPRRTGGMNNGRGGGHHGRYYNNNNNHYSRSMGGGGRERECHYNGNYNNNSGSGFGGPSNNGHSDVSKELLMGQVAMMHQRIYVLEEKNRSLAAMNEELVQYRNMAFHAMQAHAMREQEFLAEREIAVAKAKAEVMSQLLRVNVQPNLWLNPFLGADPKLNFEGAGYTGHSHPLFSSATFHAWMANIPSPCINPMPVLHGQQGMMTDLRDRYEDVKCMGYVEGHGHKKAERILAMIQKIVPHYEQQNKRIYEEIIPNQHISTLMWCDTGSLYPQKPTATVACGYGATQFEATEAALEHAWALCFGTNPEDTLPRESLIEVNPECNSSSVLELPAYANKQIESDTTSTNDTEDKNPDDVCQHKDSCSETED